MQGAITGWRYGLRLGAAAWLCLALLACHSDDEQKKAVTPAPGSDEVVLSPQSPKRGYIKEAVLQLSRRPLMDSLNGILAYDETRTARVSSPIAGRVVGPPVALGTLVAAGATLLTLDSPDLGQAEADYASAAADLTLAERAYQRVQGLYDQGIAPRKDVEQAQDGLQRARSEAERARLRLQNLGLSGARPNEHFVLRAPIAGTVTERGVTPGMEVRPDLATPLFVISDLGHLWLMMDVFEKDLGQIHVGQTVRVSVPAYPGETFEAQVDYIGRTLDDATRSVKVRCVLDNPDGRLLPKMYASVTVESGPQDLALVVPLSALFTEGETDWVFVATGDGRYRRRPVKVGLRLKDRAVVQEGLQPGERLVVDGALLLRTEEDVDSGGGDQAE